MEPAYPFLRIIDEIHFQEFLEALGASLAFDTPEATLMNNDIKSIDVDALSDSAAF